MNLDLHHVNTMPTAEGLDRKKKVRAAHRASATRNVNGAYDLIGASDLNLARLKQVKLTLTEKLKTLADCDAEILELTEEGDLESEIEQADSARERITLCIIDIDTAVDGATKSATTPPPIVPYDHLEPADEGEHERSESPASVGTEREKTPVGDTARSHLSTPEPTTSTSSRGYPRCETAQAHNQEVRRRHDKVGVILGLV